MSNKIEWKKSKIDYDKLNKLSVAQLNRIEQGIYAKETGQLLEAAIKGGKTMGNKHYKNKTGLFSMNDVLKKKAVIKGGKAAGKIAVKNGTVIKAAMISAKSPNHVNNKRLTCPHCGKEGGYTAMKRHHMDRCKFKK